MFRFRLFVAALLLGCGLSCHAYGDRFYTPYSGAYGYYNGPYRADHYLELARIRQALRDQRRFNTQQARRQDQELEALRQQSLTSHQVSADQACYYRSTGGFELCADLFAAGSDEFDSCESLVVRRNPSCNNVPLTGRAPPAE